MEEKEKGFSYTYNAAYQQEAAAIRSKYIPQEQTPIERLRQLDRSASKKAQAWAITLGVIGVLVLGCGMSLTMTDLYEYLMLDSGMAMLIGVPVGFLGMVLVALAYPVYNRVLRKERERIAPEILRLTDELMK